PPPRVGNPPRADEELGHAPGLNVWNAFDEAHELGASLRDGLEDAQHAAGEDPAVLLLHAAHLHAEVIGLDDDAHPDRLEVFLQALGDLTRHPLLYLEPSAVELHEPGHLAEAHQAAVRNVSDVNSAVEGQQMMLAERVHLDVLD